MKNIEIQKKINICEGWNSVDEVAQEIWSSIHSSLLKGNFIFAYKGKTELNRLVITRRLDNGLYMVGEVFQGYTSLLPKVSKDFILSDIVGDMRKSKLDKHIIENLIETINKN